MEFIKAIKKPSLLVVILCASVVLLTHINLPKFKSEGYTQELTFDVVSYYLYLPMTLIHSDAGMKTKTVDSLCTEYKFSPTLYQIHTTDVDTRVPNYTMGMSYSYLPSFFIAHLYAKLANFKADGFSFPYQLIISYGIYLFILPGIFFLRKFLLNYYSEKIVAIALTILFFGTNYFSEASSNYLQPHAVMFSLYVFLLYFTKKWHDSPSYLSASIIGLLAGWITLTRPTDIICILIPIMWNVYDKNSFREKIKLISKNFGQIVVFIFAAFLPFIPQFLYWKYTTGHFIYFSYKHTEGFDFLEPHIWNVLFSFKKSLFIYTPLLILPLIGLFRLSKYQKDFKYLVIPFTILNLYLLSSWAVWWCGASFGMRYFVQSYAVLSIPLCVSIKGILENNFFKKILFIPVCFLIFLNLFQTWQYIHWIIPEDRMNYAYYKASFFKTHITEEDKKIMEVWRNTGYSESFDNENEYQHYTVAYFDFENVNSVPVDSHVINKTFCLSPPNSCQLSPENIYYPTIRLRYDKLVKKNLDHVWIRATVNYYSEIDIKDNPASLVINFPHKKYNQKYRAFDIEKYPFEKNKWNTLKVDYMTPYPYLNSDSIEIYFWYRGSNKLYIDNLKVEVYESLDQLSK